MLNNDIKVRLDQYLCSSTMWDLCDLLLRKEGNQYKDINLENLRQAIYYAVEHIETIREVLPKFTVHGMQHSCNVLDIMEKLLISMQIVNIDETGTLSSLMSSYEVALLILTAFFHDIGMCLLSRDEDVSKEEWYDDYSYGKLHYDVNDLKKRYIRDCHHIRVKLFIEDYNKKVPEFGWIEKNSNHKSFLGLERICKSHNEGKEAVDRLDSIVQQDEKFCAIILRLADILDLDNTRAPLNEMEDIKFEETNDDIYSWYEWKKHRGAERVSFDSNGVLILLGKTTETIVYQKLNTMVDWIRVELDLCRELLRNTSVPYRDKRLPQMINNKVEAEGFELGQYAYEIKKNDALKLFMGENLYMDRMVFVRELLQNSIDASVYYQKIKENELNRLGYMGGILKIKPVSIHVWKDDMNKVSFLIEDSGIGMNRKIITNYFLKIGKSFYQSEAFKHSGVNFVPISRFGVGFLSAFLVTDEITVVTKHYEEPGTLLQLTLNINADEYVLRENCKKNNKYDIRQNIIDWNGDSISLARTFKEKECGTLIYFKIKEEIINGDMDRFISAIDKYLLVAPVQVHCDINGFVVEHENLQNQFMRNIIVQLEKNDVSRALHRNIKSFSEDEEIFFESLPILLDYSDDKGRINGRLQILTVYDTKFKQNSYNFSYSVDYDEDSLIVKFGGYEKNICDAGLNPDYQMLGLVNKVKIYFNGINHLSINNKDQSNTLAPAFFSGYLMLEGKFRPEVDVARSGNGFLNLETIACLNYLYFKEIQNYVKDDFSKRNAFFSLKQPEIFLDIDRSLYLEHEIFDKAIQPFNWNEISIIKTENGFLSINEIKEFFYNSGISEIELLEDITLSDSTDFRALVVRYLLKSNFRIILKINENVERVFIKSTKDVLDDYSLPPLFLIEYENLEILKYGNYPLNKQHWFSKWLIGICKSEGFAENRSFLIRHLRRNIVNNPSKGKGLVDDINKILQKYMNTVLENRDIITYRPKEQDLRDWLQVFK